MPEKLFSGKARVICDILAMDSGRIDGPPSPPLETRPSTFISNSRVSGSMRGATATCWTRRPRRRRR